MLAMKKFIPPVGEADFRDLRRANYGFVDKSFFIRDVLTDSSKVVCFPRPRRFGKSTNLSMLGYFLRKSDENLTDIFQDLAVNRDPESMQHFQKYPVMTISFKDAKSASYSQSLLEIAKQMEQICLEHREVIAAQPLGLGRTDRLLRCLAGTATEIDLLSSLRDLSHVLHEHHQERVVILIDEYDTPLHAGYAHGYFDEIVGFLRSFFSACLKDNSALFKGVLTGILRVARESMFSDLNHISVYSIIQEPYATAFGFTAQEVEAIVEPGQFDDVRAWYDGYVFGGQVIYNPWSILHYIKFGKFEPYWVNTGGTQLIESLALKHGMALSDKSATLLNGGSIDTMVNPHIVLRNIDQDPEAFWNFLFFCGYLKPVDLQLIEGRYHAKLAIPNKEVRIVYQDLFTNWLLQRDPGHAQTKEFVQALFEGDAPTVQEKLEGILLRAISIHDKGKADEQPEKLYHGFILGLLVHFEHQYEVRSNPESGYGRADVLIRPKEPGKPGAVMEFKVKSPNAAMEAVLESAAKQVRERRYAETLHAAGVERVYEYALAFDGKKVFVGLVDDVLEKAAARAAKESKKSLGKKAATKKSTRKR
jgi:Predicted AAA-ATPase/PD-(D/E)XK nuclease superfamily